MERREFLQKSTIAAGSITAGGILHSTPQIAAGGLQLDSDSQNRASLPQRELALKALARQRWPQGDPSRKEYPKCWYQPLTERQEARLGLYFTLSQGVTAAIPPGEEFLFSMALDLAMDFKPISTHDLEKAKQMAESLNPIFQSKV